MDLENKEEILEKIEKASSGEYQTSWNVDGIIGKQKKISEIKKGKKSKLSGNKFELEVRKDLEKKNYFVTKWSNNVDLEKLEMIPAKRKFNPYAKIMTVGTGFPDFVAFMRIGENFKVIGVEVKLNGILDKTEKEKCKFYVDKKIFSEIWVAKKSEDGVVYEDVKEILERMR